MADKEPRLVIGGKSPKEPRLPKLILSGEEKIITLEFPLQVGQKLSVKDLPVVEPVGRNIFTGDLEVVGTTEPGTRSRLMINGAQSAAVATERTYHFKFSQGDTVFTCTASETDVRAAAR